MKICVVYHCIFQRGDEFLSNAVDIVFDQMTTLNNSGLEDAATEIHCGVNGGDESRVFCVSLLPEKAKVTLHGLQCRNENRTLLMLEKWLPGHKDWYVLYFGSKGVSHPPNDPLRTAWRQCGMKHLVTDWRKCVADLDSGYESVGCHWMTPPKTPPTQYIWAGTFWWAKASYLLTLPSIMERARIKESGIDAFESRYEAEVFLGNGPRRPRIMDYCPGWNPGRPHQ